MKDAKSVLDAVRAQANGADKLLVLRATPGGALVASQANASMVDLMQMVDSFRLQLQKQLDLEKVAAKKGRVG